jgi:hypothetical protein
MPPNGRSTAVGRARPQPFGALECSNKGLPPSIASTGVLETGVAASVGALECLMAVRWEQPLRQGAALGVRFDSLSQQRPRAHLLTHGSVPVLRAIRSASRRRRRPEQDGRAALRTVELTLSIDHPSPHHPITDHRAPQLFGDALRGANGRHLSQGARRIRRRHSGSSHWTALDRVLAVTARRKNVVLLAVCCRC